MERAFIAIFILSLVLFVGCGSSSKSGNEQQADTDSSDTADTDSADTDTADTADTDSGDTADTENAEKLESIRNLAEEYIEFSHGTGVVVGYGTDKLTSLAYGVRSSSTQAPLSTDDLFEIGSITKNFTAATMLLLQEEGKIDLDQTIDKWFPDFEKGEKITVRMLLNHTSGILEFNEYDDLEGIVEKVSGKLNFEPGTDWSYSNTNFILAGLIINKIAEKPAHEVIREKILEPLGMTHTFMKNFEEYPIEDKAHGHTFDQYGNIVSYDLNYRFWTAGGIVSNVEDMFKYAHALFNGELLSEESMNQMLDFVKVSGIPVYGLGMMYDKGSHGGFYTHGGDVITNAALMAFYPETGEIHLLFNNFSGSSSTLDIFNDWMEYVLSDGGQAEKGSAFPDWEELVDNGKETQIFSIYAPLINYESEELNESIGYFVYPEDYIADFYCSHYMFESQGYAIKIIQQCIEPERYYQGTIKVARTDIDMYLGNFEAAAESGEPIKDFYITKYDYYYDVATDLLSKICYSLEESDTDKYIMISSSQHPSGSLYYSLWGKSEMAESTRATGCECYSEDGTARECTEDEADPAEEPVLRNFIMPEMQLNIRPKHFFNPGTLF